MRRENNFDKLRRKILIAKATIKVVFSKKDDKNSNKKEDDE